jgi:tRNA dimethylallyltransferase
MVIQELPKIIAIVGPTASGKTDLSIAVAKSVGGEIINADSRQIYRGMNIGTAKEPNDGSVPGYYAVQGIVHHLVDIADPDQEITLAHYQSLTFRAIADIAGRGKVPMLVGGTGLYVQAIIDNLAIPSVPPDAALRHELEKMTTEVLVEILTAEDPEAAEIMDQFNRRYIIRAIEIVRATGKSNASQKTCGEPRCDALLLGVQCDRDALAVRIHERIQIMLEAGLVEETKQLMSRYGFHLSAMSSIGYGEVAAYLRGEMTLPEAVERMEARTRQFARRQVTWWRRPGTRPVTWVADADEAIGLAAQFLLGSAQR